MFLLLTFQLCGQRLLKANIPISLKNFIIFSTSQSFPSSVLMSPWILYLFLLFLHWGAVLQVMFYCQALVSTCCISTCCSLVCPIRILLSLNLYCLQLLWALAHPSIHGLMYCSLVVLFSYILSFATQTSYPFDGQVVFCTRESCFGQSWHIYFLFYFIVCLSFPLIPMCVGTLHRVI